jgi:uncharacterized membrane protein YphA (DoxX/SURF4 family)
MKKLKDAFRILLGLTFIFSGFVKGIDPLGSTYKFTDYFNSFGFAWATQLSFILAILLSLAEFAIGIALVFNYRMKFFAWLSLLFMGFFLPLSMYIAIKNPVTDCGCFGDALVLSNWQTFYKNVVFAALAILIFIYRNQYINKYNIHFQNGYFVFFLLIFGAVSYYSYNHLPIIDFRPFKIGNNIYEKMTIPDDAPVDEYRYDFIYKNKNTGEEKKFNESDYPWNDTINWAFVHNAILVKKGYEPAIHNFSIENEYGEDVADFYLHDPGTTFMLVSHDLTKANIRKQKKINEFAAKALENGHHFFCLTASTIEVIDQFKEKHDAQYNFYQCDEITLKTIIRSNPGLVLLKGGTVHNKWHWNDFPEFDKATSKLEKASKTKREGKLEIENE